MPPATFEAVGAAIMQTSPYANRIGAILYGMSSDFLARPLDASSVGAFTEGCMPLFLAGVQYMDELQRHWTIGRLTEIENVTGWATVSLIANGCESSWVVADAKMGRPQWEKRYGVEDGPNGAERPVEDVTLVPSTELNGDLEPSLQEAQLRDAQKMKNFASFTRAKDGLQMWAYKVYTHEDLALINGHS